MIQLDFQKTAERWQHYTEDLTKEARNHYVDFIKSQMTISTFLISFNIFWVNQSNYQSKVFGWLIIASAFLLLSIVLGLWSMIEIHSFLNRVGEIYEKKSESLFNYMIKNQITGGKDYPKEVRKEKESDYSFSPWQFTAQAICMGVGIFLSLYLGVLVYFTKSKTIECYPLNPHKICKYVFSQNYIDNCNASLTQSFF